MSERKILYIDGNKVTQEVARLILTSLQLNVHTAESLSAAEAACTANRFDLILIDYQMLEFQGIQSLQTIKQGLQHQGIKVPIIAMTAGPAERSLEECRAMGLDDCIGRQLDSSEVAKTIGIWLGTGDNAQDQPGNGSGAAGHPSRLAPATLDYQMLSKYFKPESIKDLLSMFAESASAEVHEIGTLVSSKSYTEIQRVSHNFRGSCRTIHAVAVAETLLNLEAAAGRADESECRTLFDQLRERLTLTLLEIEDRLAALQ